MLILQRKGSFYSLFFLLLVVIILSVGCTGWRHGATTKKFAYQMLPAATGGGAERLEIEVNFNPIIRGFVQSHKTPDYIYVVSDKITQLIYIENDLLVTFTRKFLVESTSVTEEPIPNDMLALVSLSDQQRVRSVRGQTETSSHLPEVSRPTGVVEIYLFNISGWTLIPSNQDVTDNGTPLASLPRRTYSKVELSPGTHELRVPGQKLILLNTKEGDKYFVVFGYKPERSWAFPLAGNPVIMQQISEEEAQPLLKEFSTK